MKYVASLLIVLMSSGCASTNRQKTLQAMAVAGVAGIAYGLSKNSRREENAALYGGVGAATAGALGLYVWNSDQELERFKKGSSWKRVG